MVSTVIIQVYLIYGIIFLLFSFLGIKTLTRKRNRISITLSMIFIIPSLGILMNIIYRTIDKYQFNIIGNKITISLSCLGLIFIYFFAAIINQSQVAFPIRKQIWILIIYLSLLSVLFFIPNGVDFEYNGVAGIDGYNNRSLDPLDLGVPVWSTSFFLYGLIISQLLVIFLIFTGLLEYKEIGKGNIYGRKYIQTLVGLILMDIVIIGSFLFNWLNSPIGRKINLYLGICIIPAALFLYLGLKEEKKSEE